jgi:hypothetical protein
MKFSTAIVLTLFIVNLGWAQSGFYGQNFKQDLGNESALPVVEQSFVQLDSFCECEDLQQGANESWPHVLTAAAMNDGNMGEAQSFQIIVTSLPEGGANFRVAKTVANGNWYFAPGEPLELGVNDKTVAAVAFARAVKFQFSDCNVGYTVFTLNEEGVCGSIPVALGCTDMDACNYDPDATEDDQSCFSIGDECDDEDEETTNDLIDENCECTGQGEASGLEDFGVDFQMGPNPASQVVLVSASRAIERVVVINSAGATVLRRMSMSSSVELNLQGVPDGVYLVKCYIGEVWVTRRIVVSQRG